MVQKFLVPTLVVVVGVLVAQALVSRVPPVAKAING